MKTLPEVLAPAGSPACLPAAVAGGADAVYLGLRHFNARGRAENFRLVDLPQHVAYLHAHQIKAYVVLNTLLHDDEFNKAIPMAQQAHAAGIDAVLVQDLGLWHLLRRHVPDLELHASTQMTVHSRSQIAALAQMGAARIVLARELSMTELHDLTLYAASLGVETEHFVHGALCYAFSGQCLMSNFSGCRSANRGTCAQNCRYDYQRVQSEASNEFDTEISMRDLSAIESVAAMADAGVASLKIEGRLKGPDYVYTVSRAFRRAVDAWAEAKSFDLKSARRDLSRVFSRGHTQAPLQDIYDQRSRLSRHVHEEQADAYLISLQRKKSECVIKSKDAPQIGNGYAFTLNQFRDGFLITAVKAHKAQPQHWHCRIRIQEKGPAITEAIPLILNSDQAYKQSVEHALKAAPRLDSVQVKIPLHVSVTGAIDEVLQVRVQCQGHEIQVATTLPLQAAAQKPLDEQGLRSSLAAFGNSDFECASLHIDFAHDVFMPAKILKQLRRDIIEQLENVIHNDEANEKEHAEIVFARAQQTALQRTTQIIAAVSTTAAAEAALEAGASQVWLEDPLLDMWQESVPSTSHFSEHVYWRHPPTREASPHVSACTGIVAGHIGVIDRAQAAGVPVIADHYCNVVNSSSLEALGVLGAEAAVLSLECSAREIVRLAERCDEDLPQLILTVHGRLPSMLTRQDHGLAAGQQLFVESHQRDGGLPYTIERRLADDTVIWEGRHLLASKEVALTQSLVDYWLLELGDCSPESVATFVSLYQRLLAGDTCHDELEQASKNIYKYPCFPGHLQTGSRALDHMQSS